MLDRVFQEDHYESMFPPHSYSLKPRFACGVQEKRICLDIETGNGYVGIKLAKLSDFIIYYVDADPVALDFAYCNCKEAKVKNRVYFVEADVCSRLPFPAEFADFVVSRGSFWFWKDQTKGLAEIYRVLKAGGRAVIGGEFGRYMPFSMRKSIMKRYLGEPQIKRLEKASRDEIKKMLHLAGISNYTIIPEIEPNAGVWIDIKKAGNE